MTHEPARPTTRRAVLAAGAAAALTAASGVLDRPTAAMAANGDAVLVGALHTGTTATRFTTTGATGDGLVGSVTTGRGVMGTSASGSGVLGQADSGVGVRASSNTGHGLHGTTHGELRAAAAGHHDGNGVGVYGLSTASEGQFLLPNGRIGVYGVALQGPLSRGVVGQSNPGIGVVGTSITGTGVIGDSTQGDGVQGISTQRVGTTGISEGGAGIGVLGLSMANSLGILGISAGPVPVEGGRAKTGVFGRAMQDASSRGVVGQSASGAGVEGTVTSGRGVLGIATSGTGVHATATTGFALRTTGRVRLEKSAGRATISAGRASVVVTPGIDLTANSLVVATLNGNAGGITTVRRVAIDATANRFTIFLTKASTASVRVAWIVLS